MLRLLPDFTLRDSHTSTFTDTNKQYGSQAWRFSMANTNTSHCTWYGASFIHSHPCKPPSFLDSKTNFSIVLKFLKSGCVLHF
jgi:hypothetical protein